MARGPSNIRRAWAPAPSGAEAALALYAPGRLSTALSAGAGEPRRAHRRRCSRSWQPASRRMGVWDAILPTAARRARRAARRRDRQPTFGPTFGSYSPTRSTRETPFGWNVETRPGSRTTRRGRGEVPAFVICRSATRGVGRRAEDAAPRADTPRRRLKRPVPATAADPRVPHRRRRLGARLQPRERARSAPALDLPDRNGADPISRTSASCDISSEFHTRTARSARAAAGGAPPLVWVRRAPRRAGLVVARHRGGARV